MNITHKKSKGAVSTMFLVLGVILLVIIVIVFVVIKVNSAKNTKTNQDASQNTDEPVGPVYETQIADIKFSLQSAIDMGNVLQSSDTRRQPNLLTTERFVKVTIGAQNKGKLNIKRESWNIGNIVDSEGRNFVAVGQDGRNNYFEAVSDLCGALLKPEFEPTPCVKYYEVSKKSVGLKVEVYTSVEGSSKKKESGFIDLIMN